MKPYVYITQQMPADVLAMLEPACRYAQWEAATSAPRAELLAAVRDAEGLFCTISDRIDEELLAAAPRLRIVANTAVGYDNIDVAAATRHGVLVTNTPGVVTEATADMAWALMLATARRVVEGYHSIANDGWGAWSLTYMLGHGTAGKTLGVVGAGRVGAAILRRGVGFDMRLLYHNRKPSDELEMLTGAQYAPLADLLEQADYIIVAVPLTAETRGMFGAAQFAQMKDTAVFVNVARGAVVDEDALYHALQQGRPWAAGLDVFAHEPIKRDHPLLTLPNVTAAPHSGSATWETRLAMATLAAENLAGFFLRGVPQSPVNPDVLQRS